MVDELFQIDRVGFMGRVAFSISSPRNHRKDADTRAAGNGGPIPSFPGNRSGSQLIPKPFDSGLSQ